LLLPTTQHRPYQPQMRHNAASTFSQHILNASLNHAISIIQQ
jgi:hypothetical protein